MISTDHELPEPQVESVLTSFVVLANAIVLLEDLKTSAARDAKVVEVWKEFGECIHDGCRCTRPAELRIQGPTSLADVRFVVLNVLGFIKHNTLESCGMKNASVLLKVRCPP